jgi:hypothetical protein
MNPYEENNYWGLSVDPEEHDFTVPVGSWVEHLRATFSAPEIDLYRHRVHGTWVVGCWWSKEKKVFCEFLAFSDQPDRLPRAENDDVPFKPGQVSLSMLPSDECLYQNYLQPSQERFERVMKLLRKKEEETRDRAQETQQEITDLGNHMAKDSKIGDHPVVAKMQQGQLPATFGG